MNLVRNHTQPPLYPLLRKDGNVVASGTAQSAIPRHGLYGCFGFARNYILVAFIVSVSFLHAATMKDVVVHSSNVMGLAFEYRPQFNANSSTKTDVETFDVVNVENTTTDEHFLFGAPAIRERYFEFGVPSFELPVVEIVSAEYVDVPNVNLVPVPRWEKGEELSNPVYERSAETYYQSNFVPSQLYSIDAPKKNGGVAVSTIHLAPYQYNAATRTLRKYSRIAVKISFGAPKFIANGKPAPQTLEQHLLNFDVAKGWGMNRNISKSLVRFNSVLNDGNWFSIPITNDGMYKITGKTLSANGVPRNSVATIKLFNNGGREIPEDPADVSDFGDLKENAIVVVDNNNNGNFEDDDYIVFFGKDIRGWEYSAVNKQYSHYIHHYGETNVYFLTYGVTNGKRMITSAAINSPSPLNETSVLGKVFREEDKINVQESGREWLGDIFLSGDGLPYKTSLPGFIPQRAITYRFAFAARSAASSSFSVYEHQTLLMQPTIPAVQGINNDYGTFCNFVYPSITVNQNFTDEKSQLQVNFLSSSGGKGYFDWLEILYARNLQANGDVIQFTTRDTNGILQYAINNFSSNEIQGFDVTDAANVKQITPNSVTSNTITFQAQSSTGKPVEFYICGGTGMKNVTTLRKMGNQNLHGDTSAIDYVIVTSPTFLDQAMRLKNYRQLSAKRPLHTVVATLPQVYNEFSCGVPDVSAIRNYVKYLYETDTPARRPKYLLLFGDGDFDYKRIVAAGENFIPPWESENSFGSLIESYSSDDFFGSFSSPLDVDLGVGRLCIRSLSDAEAVVDKIIEYETKPVHDGWKNRVVYVSDDFNPDGTLHNRASEELAQFETPSLFEKVKVYEAEFPTVATSLGRRKPDANTALINVWNEGALMINFTGHGNPRVWTHEQMFTRESTIPQLRNAGKYPFVVAATCNFGQFDNSGTQSSAEIMVNKPGSGAIAVFGATRAVYAYSNAVLNETLYQKMLREDSTGRLIPIRLGDAVFRAKRTTIVLDNDNQHRFYLLGDPALDFGFPEQYATIDRINDSTVSSTKQVLLRALSKPALHSIVIDSSGNKTNFTGNGTLSVFDSYRQVNIQDDGGSYTYMKTGNVLFRGAITLSNGVMQTRCIIPKDISYDTTFNARIAVYFYNDQHDGAGVTEFLRVGSTDSSALNDSVGPNITVYLDNTQFRSGDVVSTHPKLLIQLRDSSGINTSGSGVGHKLEARLDDSPQGIDVSAYYQSDVNDFTRGNVEYQFNSIGGGDHKLFVRAWDTYNNATETTVKFSVISSTKISLQNVYNYPNPFSKETYFTFIHNQLSPIEVEVKIFTVTGRLIQSLHEFNINDKFVRVHWDGKDRDGDEVANGLYLYKVVATSTDKKFSDEVLGKLSIVR